MIVLRWGSAAEPRQVIENALLVCGVKKVLELEAREGPGRRVRQGTAVVDECPMAWRTDQLSALPIQLLVCVPVPLFDRFAWALDSFQLSEAAPRLLSELAPPRTPRKRR